MLVDVSAAAYAAGLFDGEGHISIHYRKATKTNRNGRVYSYERFEMHVSMSQIDGRPLAWLKEKFGGAVWKKTGKRSYNEVIYTCWCWSMSAKKAADFLMLIRPFLMVKGEEADIALEFYKTLDHTRRRRQDAAVRANQARLAAKLKEVRHAVKNEEASAIHGRMQPRDEVGEMSAAQGQLGI